MMKRYFNRIIKIAFIIFLFSISYHNCTAQSNADTSLATFAKNKGYILLSDSTNLPKSIMPYYKDILAYLSVKAPYMISFYVYKKHIQNGQTYLTIPLEDMTTIVYRKKWDALFAYNESHPDTVYSNGKMGTMVKLPPIAVGNVSGRDVVLRIDKTTRKISMGLTQ